MIAGAIIGMIVAVSILAVKSLQKNRQDENHTAKSDLLDDQFKN